MTARSLVELVLEGADAVPGDKPAVRAGEASEIALSYSDLVRGAGSIAASFKEAGVGRGDRVGIWMDKTPTCVQVILGVMWAGAAYVPLDPRAPWRRCRAIADDCDFAGMAVDAPRLRFLPDVLPGQPPRRVLIDRGRDPGMESGGPAGRDASWEDLAPCLTRPAPGAPLPVEDDPAYILYTSGSTGTPKGVVHTHRSGLAFVRWVQQRFGIVAQDVFSSHAPFHFDLSISDLYASLGRGATVHLISAVEAMLAAYLVRKMPEWRITVWYSVPWILVSMLDRGGLEQQGLGTVRAVLFAGEVFPTLQLRRLRTALPGVRLFNLFGPTETNVCTCYEVPASIPDDWTAPISIGRDCENMETFVMDDEGKEAEAGNEGTLWARGDNLMQGYWNDTARTEATLRPDPRGRAGMACCTGDRVRLQPDGNYQFLGRLDSMVKVRGNRVDLGDIESTLTTHSAVLEAVVVTIPNERTGVIQLAASVVSRERQVVDPAELRSFCTQRLPSYMVPERVEIRAALPRTSTGKADRRALRSEWQSREQG